MPTAGSDWEEIAWNEVTSTSTAVISFSSISQSYKDLVLVMSCFGSGSDITFRFNDDSGANYGIRGLWGNKTQSPSFGTWNGSYSYGYLTYYGGPSTTIPSVMIARINGYTNGKRKIVHSTIGNYDNGFTQNLSKWDSSSAINKISINHSSTTLQPKTTFGLYGIKE